MNRFLAILLVLSLCRAGFALETDQYNRPTKNRSMTSAAMCGRGISTKTCVRFSTV